MRRLLAGNCPRDLSTKAKRSLCPAAFLLLGVASFTAPSWAEEEPRLVITIPSEVQYNNFFQSENSVGELGDAFAKIEPEASFRLGAGFSLEGQLTYEAINPAPIRDRFFDNQGLYVKQIFLNFERDGFSLHAGKFAPSFGLAWDSAPGVFGRDFARDYELTEQIGVGGTLEFDGPADTSHQVSLNAFHRDKSAMTRSWFNRRTRVRDSSGGFANTDDLSSYSATLAGDTPLVPSYKYQISYDHLAAGRGNPTDEDGYAVALFGESGLTEQWKLLPFAELAYFSGAKVVAEDRSYGTLGLSVTDDTWEMNVSFTSRVIDPDAAGTADTRDKLYQAGVSRNLPYGINLGLGYRQAEEAGITSHAIGLLLKREFSFSAF